VAEEDSTAADFMGVADQGFTGVEVSTPEATLPTAADTTTADIVAVTTEDGATTEVPALWLGRGLGDGRAGRYWGRGYGYGWAGDLASGGRIGVGDIRMATTTARDITRPTLIILTCTIPILTTGTTIFHRQILTHGLSPTRTDPQDHGAPRHQEAQPMRTTQTARRGGCAAGSLR
jgi:hypothetical protein